MRRSAPYASASGSYRDLTALASGDAFGAGPLGGGNGAGGPGSSADPLAAGGPLAFTGGGGQGASRASLDSADTRRNRVILVANHLPVTMTRSPETDDWVFEWDEDALLSQAAEGVGSDVEVLYVGCLPVEVDLADQELVALELFTSFRACPVFLGSALKERYYKRFCKQQLWPLLHYLLPLTPSAAGRFDPDLWQAYVKANKAFADKLVEVAASEDDLVWIHDYHLLALPSLLRRRAHRARIGLFLHSPFPSSEIFRTFPRREEVLRALLNADLVGFHTFDYARHFLSACARMLGLEHVAARGAIQLEYCGRAVGIKIMPTGVKPERWLASCAWPATLARRSELGAALAGRTVLLGVDDLDAFKGIDLKALALERLLDQHPALRGRVTLIQASGPPRGAAGREEEELTAFIGSVVARVNAKYGDPAGRGDPTGAAGLACGPDGGPAPYTPIIWLRRALPMAERVALYAAADVVVVMAVRDGMNLVPYEYVACRQGAAVVDGAAGGAPGAEGGDTAAGAAAALAAAAAAASTTAAPSVRAGMASLGSAGGSAAGLGSGVGGGSGGGGGSPRSPGGGASNPPGAHSTLVVSEFVGCSPSLSGAIRCNPWSVCAVADALHTALSLPPAERALRHANHWRYVSTHTTRFWAASFVSDLRRLTAGHGALRCYALGLGLDSFRLVALTPAFRRLDPAVLAEAYARSERRLFLLDYDGTLNSPSTSASVSAAPSEAVLATLGALVSDPKNSVYVVSGRARGELGPWFAGLGPGLGIAAEHGYYFKPPGSPAWTARGDPGEDGWRAVVLPILQLYSESTDGAWVEAKESALVWHYGAADPDFGAWQAKELLDHLEGVLSTEPAEAVAGSGIVEVKPRGVSKGKVAERVLEDAASRGAPPSFVLCVGDDRSDEDMFAAMEGVAFSPHALAEVFACTVGQKPSRAPFYVNDTADVGAALALLVDTPPKAPSSAGATSPRLVAAAAAAGAAVAAAGSRGAGGSPRVGAA